MQMKICSYNVEKCFQQFLKATNVWIVFPLIVERVIFVQS
jgi:hypothetical protein